jgi:hypothetical protein
MRVTVYADAETAKEIRQAMKEAKGHCPCVLPSKRNEDTLCMCKNFREAPAGTVCHCGLYKKIED